MNVETHTSVPSPDLLRQVRRLEIRARRQVAALFAGRYHSVFRGRGLEFSEVREYQPGDDVRIIDWNVTARIGAPYVKKFVEERELTVLLALDVSASQRFGSGARSKGDVAAELAALLAFAAAGAQDRVGLVAFTDRVEHFVPPRRGPRQALRLLRDVLALQPAGDGTDIGAALGYLERTLQRRAVIFLISDFLGAGYERVLSRAARRHDVIALVLSDPREMALPTAGIIEAEDAETGERISLDSNDAAVRARFASQALAASETLRRSLADLGVDAVEISADGDYLAPLLAYVRERARRR
jgi:uncharacterized protein (DUF58 family)